MENFTPKQIVAELDKYIIGQTKAKKSVAVALRNRYRRKLLTPEIRDEIVPKNIIMIGPTGVGKTEIARRIAKLVGAPFVKVEATKFTEVGYVGRDVESIIRDLVETSIRMVRTEKMKTVEEKAINLANEKIIEILVPTPNKQNIGRNPFEMLFGGNNSNDEENEEQYQQQKNAVKIQRETLKTRLLNGELEKIYIEIEVDETAPPMVDVFSGAGMEGIGVNIQDMLGGFFPKKKKQRKVTVADARKILIQEEAQKLIDMDEVIAKAIERAEQTGIVFLDEIDKIAGKEAQGPDVSRGGVQRDILPIVEGSTVITKYGPVKTDYILFIAAGAFHVSKPSDLIPELQGRFPIRVELESLSEEDFKQILVEPKNSLIKQYTALLQTEGIKIEFAENSIAEIAKIAYTVNEVSENIGARRLHTLMEKLLEDISFNANEMSEQFIVIDDIYVRANLSEVVHNQDIKKYIL